MEIDTSVIHTLPLIDLFLSLSQAMAINATWKMRKNLFLSPRIFWALKANNWKNDSHHELWALGVLTFSHLYIFPICLNLNLLELFSGEEFLIHLKVSDAVAARDSFSKTVYSRLFQWIVSSINLLIHHPSDNKAMIGELYFIYNSIVFSFVIGVIAFFLWSILKRDFHRNFGYIWLWEFPAK